MAHCRRTSSVAALAAALALSACRPGGAPAPPATARILALAAAGRPVEACVLLDELPTEEARRATLGLDHDARGALVRAGITWAEARTRLGLAPAAQNTLRWLVALEGRTPDLLLLAARCREAEGAVDEARRAYDDLLRSEPGCLAAFEALLRLERGDPEQLYALRLRIPPGAVPDDRLYLRLGELLEGHGRLDQAAAVYALARGRVRDPAVSAARERALLRAAPAAESAAPAAEPAALSAPAPAPTAPVRSDVSPSRVAALPAEALPAIAKEIFRGMDRAALMAWAGEPARRARLPAPPRKLVGLAPMERWVYLSADGRSGFVVVLQEGVVLCVGAMGGAAEPKPPRER